jgi:para-nitrobenzyl esterase
MNPRAETRFGPVAGTLDGNVLSFRGIPYAFAPIGERRWRPPEPPEAWPGTLDARRFGPAAPQNAPRDRATLAHSEDCLTLNVWTPALDGALRPVLVWLHGGEFTRGAAGMPEHNPSRLVRRGDVVAVSVQYRLGALGFLDPGEAEGAANLGLLDQIAALRFVHDEVDAFGGDPRRVTLVGSGAGATSALALIAAGMAPLLFQRAILQGPEVELHTPESAAEVRASFLEALRVRARRDALEQAKLDAILRAQHRCEQRFSPGAAFRPTLDGQLVPIAPLDALARGAAREIPLLAGANVTEAASISQTAAERVLESQVRGEGRAFAYRFWWAQTGSLPDAPSEVEVPFVMGTLETAATLPSGIPVTSQTKTVARRMQDAWLAFARGGAPGHPTPDAWPPYDLERRHVARFAVDGSAIESVEPASQALA